MSNADEALDAQNPDKEPELTPHEMALLSLMNRLLALESKHDALDRALKPIIEDFNRYET